MVMDTKSLRRTLIARKIAQTVFNIGISLDDKSEILPREDALIQENVISSNPNYRAGTCFLTRSHDDSRDFTVMFLHAPHGTNIDTPTNDVRLEVHYYPTRQAFDYYGLSSTIKSSHRYEIENHKLDETAYRVSLKTSLKIDISRIDHLSNIGGEDKDRLYMFILENTARRLGLTL